MTPLSFQRWVVLFLFQLDCEVVFVRCGCNVIWDDAGKGCLVGFEIATLVGGHPSFDLDAVCRRKVKLRWVYVVLEHPVVFVVGTFLAGDNLFRDIRNAHDGVLDINLQLVLTTCKCKDGCKQHKYENWQKNFFVHDGLP